MLYFDRYRRLISSSILASTVLLTACSSIGPQILPSNRREFNSSLQRSDKEQLLLNIVRMQYTDQPYFLGVSSVNASMSFSSSLGGSWSWSGTIGQAHSNSVSLSPSLNYSDSPTISYSPLQGEDFTKQMMTPISLPSLFLLLRSGWSSARILRITTQAIGPLENAPSAARPSSSRVPIYKDFVEAAHLMRNMQQDGSLRVSGTADKESASMTFHLINKPGHTKEVRRLQQLFKLGPNGYKFTITEGSKDKRSAKTGPIFAIQTRSVMGMLYYLSKSVTVSEEEKRSGVVDFPKTKDGKYFDWRLVTNGMICIRSSEVEPLNPVVAVIYRNRWYYIADNDTNSKETLSMMSQIFSLLAGNVEGPKPVLTLPI